MKLTCRSQSHRFKCHRRRSLKICNFFGAMRLSQAWEARNASRASSTVTCNLTMQGDQPFRQRFSKSEMKSKKRFDCREEFELSNPCEKKNKDNLSAERFSFVTFGQKKHERVSLNCAIAAALPECCKARFPCVSRKSQSLKDLALMVSR